VDNARHQKLFRQLLEEKLSPEEAKELVAWLGTDQLDTQAASLILARLNQSVTNEEITSEVREALEARLPAILGGTREPAIIPRIPLYKKRWIAWAAAVIILFGTSLFVLLSKKSIEPPVVINSPGGPASTDIAPGKEGAILTLEDGTRLVLDSLGNGQVAMQNGTKVVLHNGQLVYNTEGAASKEIAYNTISTPRGRQFQLVLPDQTKVWLNAASSLRYPTIFTGKEREVEITGEAYFEVAKNAAMPFRVKLGNNAGIEVLGTHFNVNSYQDEASMNTTLLEGSVKIYHGTDQQVIKPGEQAQVFQTNSPIKVVSDVNVDKQVAWKNGVFDFEDATLEEVMRQLERWYDIDVVYEKGVPPLEFVGKMGRDLSLSNVLKGLEFSKVHCRLEGRKLVVLP
jgi:transmembrane sensor